MSEKQTQKPKKADNFQYCRFDRECSQIILRDKFYPHDNERYIQNKQNMKIYDVIELNNDFEEITINTHRLPKDGNFDESIDNSIIANFIDYGEIIEEIYKNEHIISNAGYLREFFTSKKELKKLRTLIDALDVAHAELTKLLVLKEEMCTKLKNYFENKFNIKFYEDQDEDQDEYQDE
jgi:hypothetical protein